MLTHVFLEPEGESPGCPDSDCGDGVTCRDMLYFAGLIPAFSFGGSVVRFLGYDAVIGNHFVFSSSSIQEKP